MLDLGSLEENLYSSLLIQFSFICFFTPYLLYAGLISFIINIIVIILTINLYTKVTRRTISRKVTNIGIWNNLYNIVSYLAVVFNAFAVSLSGEEQGLLTGRLTFLLPKDRTASEFVYDIQNLLLIAKFILNIVIPTLPSWIEKKLTREKLIRERERKKNSNVLSRLSRERVEKEMRGKGRISGNNKSTKFEEDIYKEKLEAHSIILEGDDTKNLKFYFENDQKVFGFEDVELKEKGLMAEKIKVPKPIVKVRKAKENRRR